MPRRFLDRDALGPKDRIMDIGPVLGLTIRRFKNRFTNVVVAPLDRTLRARVVRRDAYVVDMVALSKQLDGGDVLRRIVSDELLDRTIAAE